MILAVQLLIIVQSCLTLVGAKCTIDVNKDYNVSSPLLLSTSSLDVVYPEKSSPQQLSFRTGQRQLVYCPGGQLTRFNVSTEATSEVSKCLADRTFASVPAHGHGKSVEYTFDRLVCAKSPLPITRQDPTRKCSDNGVVVNIGYQVREGSAGFKAILDLCHVRELGTTSWAHARIPAAIGGNKNRDSGSPAFSKGSYFEDVLITQVYPRSHQVKTFMGIFDEDEELVERYLPQNGPSKNYFVRGHLVARADLFYYPEQASTYFYLNVLPMWMSINNGNWKSVESTVRRVASVTGDLDVWTGGLGVLRLSGREIHLARDRRNSSRKLVPAPKLLFKLVHSAAKNEAMVFLTANDPYVRDSEIAGYRVCREYKGCKDKFGQFEKRFEGYTYCCLYEDFVGSEAGKGVRLPVELKNVAPLTLY